jgi:hypothetical protein
MSDSYYHQPGKDTLSQCTIVPATVIKHFVEELFAPLPFETLITIVVLELIALAILVFAILLYLSRAPHGNHYDEFEEEEEDEESMVFMRGSKM